MIPAMAPCRLLDRAAEIVADAVERLRTQDSGPPPMCGDGI